MSSWVDWWLSGWGADNYLPVPDGGLEVSGEIIGAYHAGTISIPQLPVGSGLVWPRPVHREEKKRRPRPTTFRHTLSGMLLALGSAPPAHRIGIVPDTWFYEPEGVVEFAGAALAEHEEGFSEGFLPVLGIGGSVRVFRGHAIVIGKVA